jgi:hypothetical protein
MQCPSCEFQNMPGLESCGRCGTSLSFRTATIDVNPPRASKTAKRLRKIMPHETIYRARDLAVRVRAAAAGSTINDSRVPLPEPAILSRLLVPGWAHIHSGLVIRGRFFLAAYVVLIVLGLGQWGTPFGPILVGLAFSVHTSSVVDILIRQGTVRFPRMMATAMFVSLALAVLIYAPAGFLLSRMAAPIEFAHDAEPFRLYDVVLVNRWAYALTSPGRGAVVVYSPLSLSRVGYGDQFGHVRYAFEENELIDRVVGLPGDHVVWDAGKLAINGAAVDWKPLIAERLPAHLDLTVPADRYLILPTTSGRAMAAGGSETFWRSSSMIPVRDILGRAYLRISPLSRLWLIR